MTEDEPNPGSDEAIERGCTCPVLDNGHGRGYMGNGAKYGFVITAGCPLHGVRRGIQPDETKDPE
jgi:hypothetical protein